MANTPESTSDVDTTASASGESRATETNPDLVEAKTDVQTPQFADLPAARSENGTSMDHLYDVSVEVSAEIGRVSMTLGELLRIGEGAVIKLNRQVSAPVELVAQGVRVALADVVVVDDYFAVRVRSIERSR